MSYKICLYKIKMNEHVKSSTKLQSKEITNTSTTSTSHTHTTKRVTGERRGEGGEADTICESGGEPGRFL